jgi:hypothetical protein
MKPTFRLHKLPQGYVLTSDEKGEGKGINVPVIAQDFDFSSLSPEDQKEIGWFDVEKLAIEYEKNHYDGDLGRGPIKIYCDAFQKAQELLSDKRFTLEDIRKALELKNPFASYVDSDEHIIQSLSQPKSWEVEVEIETVYEDKLEGIEFIPRPVSKQPKLTNGKVKVLRIIKP